MPARVHRKRGPRARALPYARLICRTPWQTSSAPPIVGYDEMSAQQVASLIASGALTYDQLAAVRVYETGTTARKTVLDKLDKALLANR